MTTVTREMIGAAHDVTLAKGDFVLSAALLERIYLAMEQAAPATAPAWNNVPTCEGLWLCDEGDENPYRFTCHDISMPLNPHLVGEGERWYGPIPENTQ